MGPASLPTRLLSIRSHQNRQLYEYSVASYHKPYNPFAGVDLLFLLSLYKRRNHVTLFNITAYLVSSKYTGLNLSKRPIIFCIAAGLLSRDSVRGVESVLHLLFNLQVEAVRIVRPIWLQDQIFAFMVRDTSIQWPLRQFNAGAGCRSSNRRRLIPQ